MNNSKIRDDESFSFHFRECIFHFEKIDQQVMEIRKCFHIHKFNEIDCISEFIVKIRAYVEHILLTFEFDIEFKNFFNNFFVRNHKNVI